MISKITGMDIANASLYDGGSACAEAVLMAHRIARGKKNKALISNRLNPQYKEVVKTYCWAQNIELEWFDEIPDDVSEYCCVLVQYPDYYGEITEINKVGTTLIVCANISALSIIAPPTEADIVVAFSLLICCSLVWIVSVKACSPSASTVLPTSLPGICRIKHSLHAIYPA